MWTQNIDGPRGRMISYKWIEEKQFPCYMKIYENSVLYEKE